MSINTLVEKIKELSNPTVVGLDPRIEYIPEHIVKPLLARYGENLHAVSRCVLEFNKGLVDALCDIVPAVKPQSAYYELLGWCLLLDYHFIFHIFAVFLSVFPSKIDCQPHNGCTA